MFILDLVFGAGPFGFGCCLSFAFWGVGGDGLIGASALGGDNEHEEDKDCSKKNKECGKVFVGFVCFGND